MTSTTAPKKRLESAIVGSPVRLLEKLSLIDAEQGNTPRPSTSVLMFISGMQSLKNGNLKGAIDKVNKAVDAAQKSGEKEELAAALLGQGYLLTIQDGTSNVGNPVDLVQQAITLYKRSLVLWKQIHEENSIKLIILLSDIAQMESFCKNKQGTLDTLNQCKSIYHANGQDNDTNQEYKQLLEVIAKTESS